MFIGWLLEFQLNRWLKLKLKHVPYVVQSKVQYFNSKKWVIIQRQSANKYIQEGLKPIWLSIKQQLQLVLLHYKRVKDIAFNWNWFSLKQSSKKIRNQK